MESLFDLDIFTLEDLQAFKREVKAAIQVITTKNTIAAIKKEVAEKGFSCQANSSTRHFTLG